MIQLVSIQKHVSTGNAQAHTSSQVSALCADRTRRSRPEEDKVQVQLTNAPSSDCPFHATTHHPTTESITSYAEASYVELH